MSDAELDAVAAVQARLDGDGDGLAVILGSCDLRETCEALAGVSAHAVSLLGPRPHRGPESLDVG